MVTAVNTLLVDGTFDDQVIELAEYIDNLRPNETPIASEIQPMLEKGEKEDVMEKLVEASSVLSTAPEKEFIPAYNLLIHLIRSSPLLPQFVDTVTTNLQKPVKSSPNNSSALTLSILSTIFNILPAESSLRYDVFTTIVKVVAANGLYDMMVPQLKNLDKWLQEWECGPEEARALLIQIADVAEAASDDKYFAYLVQALMKFPADEADEDEARDLAVRIVKAAINIPSQLELGTLPSLEPVKALANTDSDLYSLLEIFVGGDFRDYEEFVDEHNGFLESNGIDEKTASRKIRLLSLASLAASSPDRSLPYSKISSSLQIPSTDVEMWVIDVIRAGLVEGKLSQLNQTLLIHRCTYRTFGKQQWTDVGNRLETWKQSIRNVLEVVKQAREQVANQTDREKNQAERMIQTAAEGVAM